MTPQARERWLVQLLSLLFVAAWLGLFVLIAVRVFLPELRALSAAL